VLHLISIYILECFIQTNLATTLVPKKHRDFEVGDPDIDIDLAEYWKYLAQPFEEDWRSADPKNEKSTK